VFADPSGQRRRLMRWMALGLAALMIACLVAVVVALAGGPEAPFTHWIVPNQPAAAGQGHGSGQAGSAHHAKRGATKPAPQPAPGPSGSAARSSASPSSSPVPTNRAGKTPPGRSKSPNPHRSHAA
jgi:predicted lipid-binding transport protein (Tim44 family)